MFFSVYSGEEYATLTTTEKEKIYGVVIIKTGIKLVLFWY